MCKRHFASLFCLLLCGTLLLSGCSIDLSGLLDGTSQGGNTTNTPHLYETDYQDAWQYGTLSAQERAYYGYLYTAVMDAEEKDSTLTFTDGNGDVQSHPGVRVSLPDASLTQERISALFDAFFRDNPQFFYLSRTYHLEGRTNEEGEILSYDTLLLQFTMPVEERRSAIAQMNQISNEILQGCPTTDDEYEKELYIHDKIAEGCVYDQSAADGSADDHPNAYNAYGALVEGKAVCEGYAKAMQLLLNRSGISATVITGNSRQNGISHMWNLVEINGETYYLDPTWDDNGTYLQHAYFNLTSEMLDATHTLDANQAAVTVCTATADNYFVRNNTYIDTYERQVIAEAIANQILEGNTIIQLRFAKDKFSNAQLFLKNFTLASEMVNPHLAAAGLSLWNYQLWLDEEQQVLTLIKS